MAQRVFSFISPVDINQTKEIITETVTELDGKVKAEGNVLTASWWIKGATTLSHKFTFYVGKDVVRVVTSDSTSSYKFVKWEHRLNSVLKVWDGFIKVLTQKYPDLDFALESGKKMHIVGAKVMSDGIEQVFSSTSVSRPSIGGALIGGTLFGGVGAIVGGSGGKTVTRGTTSSAFSSYILVHVRYSNGFNMEGSVLKQSKVYNRILVDLSELDNI